MVANNLHNFFFYFFEIIYKIICILMMLVMWVGVGWGYPIDLGVISIFISLLFLTLYPINKDFLYKSLNVKAFLYIVLCINFFPSRFFTGEKSEDFMGVDVPFVLITLAVFFLEFFSRYKHQGKWF